MASLFANLSLKQAIRYVATRNNVRQAISPVFSTNLTFRRTHSSPKSVRTNSDKLLRQIKPAAPNVNRPLPLFLIQLLATKTGPAKNLLNPLPLRLRFSPNDHLPDECITNGT